MDSKLPELAVSFLRELSWRRIAYLIVILLLAAVSVIFWINREYIAGSLRPQMMSTEVPPLSVTDAGKEEIRLVLNRLPYIVNAISVVRADMGQNTRRVIYFASNDSEIQRQNDEFMRMHFTPDIPLFNEDEENNKRLIRLINGETVCVEFSKSNAAKYMHGIDVKYTCATGIPPYYGKFRGTVLAFIRIIPDAEEQARIRILLRDLSDKLDQPSSQP